MTKEECKAIVSIAEKYYSKKKLDHAMCVMNYVFLDTRYELMSPEEKNMITAIAIAHDIIEDTKCSWNELQSCIVSEEERREFYIAVDLLTHRYEDTYDAYIDKIIKSKNIYAIIVKQADMKDHLMRKETLTKKKKEKYMPVLPKLLRA